MSEFFKILSIIILIFIFLANMNELFRALKFQEQKWKPEWSLFLLLITIISFIMGKILEI